MMQQLWQQIATGQTKSITLLALAVGFFFYFLPSVVGFVRGNRHFWLILHSEFPADFRAEPGFPRPLSRPFHDGRQ